MQEPPRITIIDPRDPGEPGDVLRAGNDRPPVRIPRKVLLVGLAVALLAGGAYVGVDRYQQHQAEVRRQAAAFAVADTVHVHVALDPEGVTAVDAGSYETQSPDGSSHAARRPPPAVGELDVPLRITDDADSLDTISSAALEDSDLGVTFDASILNGRIPGTESGDSIALVLQCDAVAAGRYPHLGSLVVTVVPASGRRHHLVLPLTSPTSIKELALTACDLPDPTAVPTASLEAQGRLLLSVEGVPRVPSALRVLAIRSPGLALAEVGGEHHVQPGVNLFMDISVRLTDCAAARTGNGVVTLTLRDDRRTYVLTAADAPPTSFRQPGDVWLRALVARSCP